MGVVSSIPVSSSRGGTGYQIWDDEVKALAFGLALRLSNIIEHDSDPAPGVRSTDCDLVLGLQYGF
ncbi:MAG TPA: hypothetical protein PLI53_02340 [Geobacteraceae bacterium]|nr:hypothetical protein [Geobacteraceae bacterium]